MYHHLFPLILNISKSPNILNMFEHFFMSNWHFRQTAFPAKSCGSDGDRCFPSHTWLGSTSNGPKVGTVSARALATELEDQLADLHVVPGTTELGNGSKRSCKLRPGLLWSKMIQHFWATWDFTLYHLEFPCLKYSPIYLQGAFSRVNFQVTLRKPKDDVWACAARRFIILFFKKKIAKVFFHHIHPIVSWYQGCYDFFQSDQHQAMLDLEGALAGRRPRLLHPAAAHHAALVSFFAQQPNGADAVGGGTWGKNIFGGKLWR